MTVWEIFNSVFWITLATILSGSVGLALKYCLKSKCRNLSCCWGFLIVDRDVDIEAQEEMKELEIQTTHKDSPAKIPSIRLNRMNSI